MTLKAIADELNTTTVTIYRRLEREGLKIKDLRDPDTKELTPQGAATIAALYKNTGTTPDEQAIKQIITGVMTGDGTGDTDEQPRQTAPEAAQVAALTATVDGLRALVSQLEGERNELRRQLAQVTAALQAEQADRQQERLLLTGATATDTGGHDHDQQRRGWLKRLFNR